MKKMRIVPVIITVVILFINKVGLVAADGPSLQWPVQNPGVTQGFTDKHNAIDIQNSSQSEGAAVYAADTGDIIEANWHSSGCNGTNNETEWLALPENERSKECGGYYVKIKHNSGNYYTWYFHLLGGSFPMNTRPIQKGQHLATMGQSGTTTGVHLHFVLSEGSDLSKDAVIPTLSFEPTPDTTPPNITLESPRSDQIFVNQIEATADSSDDNSQVKKVEFHLFHDGGWQHVITDEDSSDGWNATWDVSGVGEQTGIQVVAWVEDYAGNQQQSGAATNLKIDRTAPQVEMTDPSQGDTFDNTLDASADASDNISGIKKVEFHFIHSLGTEVIVDESGSDGWNVTWDTSNLYPQNDVKVLVWAEDWAGNRKQSGQIGGLVKQNVDVTAPGIWIQSPQPRDLVKDTVTFQVKVADESDIVCVDLFVYYYEQVDGGFKRHDFPCIPHSHDDIWAYDVNLFAAEQRAIAQNEAQVQAIARDIHNNQGASGVTNFSIKIGNREFWVDGSKVWNQMNDVWGTQWPMFRDSLVYIRAVKTNQYFTYSAPDQTQVPEGDGSVCLGSDFMINDGACKALIYQTRKYDTSIKHYGHIGGNGATTAEFKAKYDGYFRLGFNDALSSFGDNSGRWKVKVSIYPPDTNSVGITQVRVNEKSQCAEGTCPHVELWTESYGSIKKLGEWTTGSTSWATRVRNDSVYLLNNLDAIWLLYDNNWAGSGDRNYYVQSVNVNGHKVYATDPGVVYYTGNGTDPFRKLNQRSGQEKMAWNGALRFPFN